MKPTTLAAATLVLSSSVLSAANPPAARPPNVVIILADDLGYGDVSVFGGKAAGVETPRLDRMAELGVRFTDCTLPANVCSPSRAALLTGRYPQRCGVPVAVNPDEKHANYGLQREEVTLAEILKDRGYATACIGKWHLGTAEDKMPNAAGFEYFFGLESNFSHNPELLENGKVINPDPDPHTLTKAFTDKAISFIKENRERPFFLYLAHIAVHGPLVPAPEFQGRSGKGRYEDFVMELDARCGEILDVLEKEGLSKETLVVFLSDNGSVRPQSNAPFRGTKFTTLEGGHRSPLILMMPESLPPGSVVSGPVSSMDLFPTIANLAGAKMPSDRTIDGRDIWAAVTSGRPMPPRTFYFYNGTNLQAVREGDWKLHLPRTAADQPWWAGVATARKNGIFTLDTPLLYNLPKDPGEATDVAASQTETLQSLTALAEVARKELGDVNLKGSDVRPTGVENIQQIKGGETGKRKKKGAKQTNDEE